MNEPLILAEFVIIILLCIAGSRPLDGWGGGGGSGLQKNIFWPFGPQFGLKIRGEGGVPPLDPSLLQILSKNVVVAESSYQMSGKKM